MYICIFINNNKIFFSAQKQNKDWQLCDREEIEISKKYANQTQSSDPVKVYTTQKIDPGKNK